MLIRRSERCGCATRGFKSSSEQSLSWADVLPTSVEDYGQSSKEVCSTFAPVIGRSWPLNANGLRFEGEGGWLMLSPKKALSAELRGLYSVLRSPFFVLRASHRINYSSRSATIGVDSL